jgi:hypothetical protein
VKESKRDILISSRSTQAIARRLIFGPEICFTRKMFTCAALSAIVGLFLLSPAPAAGATGTNTNKATDISAQTGAKAQKETKAEELPEAEQPINWTPILMSTTGIIRPFQGSDGLWNIVYEVELTNYIGSNILIDSIEVLDAGDKTRVLYTLKDKDLEEMMFSLSTFHNKFAKHAAMGPGGLAIAFINITLKDKSEAPPKVIHRIKYHTTKGKEANKPEAIVSTTREVNHSDPIVIGPPLDGGKWLAYGGYAGKLGHRKAIFPIDNHLVLSQRYAIDWIRIDDEGFTTAGDASKLENARCYNQPVYAVADGKVVGVIGRFPNQPFHKPSGDRYFPGGNMIMLEIGKDAYVFYAHLKPDSILVKDGDKVKRGQQIASLGNTGNTTGPHLHMHVTIGPKPLGSSSMPYVFDSFELVGKADDLDKFESNDAKGKQQTIAPVEGAGLHHNELVKEGHIVRFTVQKPGAEQGAAPSK